MAAGAHDLSLVGDALAVGAAIFLFVGGSAITGGVCAFFCGGHVYLRDWTSPGHQASPAWTVWMRVIAKRDAGTVSGRGVCAIS
jgi:hypothetical protein